MFYRFSNLAGRVVSSSQLSAYRPQGLQVYAGIAKPIVFTSRTAAPVKEAPLIRQASNASNKAAVATGLDPALASIRELTAHEKKMLNSIDHSVIWKTFGTDVLGFYVATAAVLVAIGSTAYALYTLLIPPQ